MKSPSGVKVLGSDLKASANDTFLSMINIDFTKKEGVYRTVCAHALPNIVNLFKFRAHSYNQWTRINSVKGEQLNIKAKRGNNKMLWDKEIQGTRGNFYSVSVRGGGTDDSYSIPPGSTAFFILMLTHLCSQVILHPTKLLARGASASLKSSMVIP